MSRVFALVLSVVACTVAQAQTDASGGPDRYAWISGSVGPSFPGDGGGAATIALGFSDSVVMIRGAYTDTSGDEAFEPSAPPFEGERTASVREVGVLYGRTLVRTEALGVVASAGLAATFLDLDVADEFGSFRFENRATVGVPVQLEVMAFPLASTGLGFGLGARVGANLNTTRSVGTAQIALYIGGLK